MQHLKEKVPKKGVRPSVVLLVMAVAGTAILSLGATTQQQAFAQANAPPDQDDGSGFSEGHGTPRENPGQPPDPDCWGEVTTQLVDFDDGQAGIGDHASSFREPRDGVGNQLEDTPSEHGEVVGDMIDIHCIPEEE